MSLVNQQIRALAERVAASHGLEVVDLEFLGGGGKHRTLRIFLERDAAGRAELEQRLLDLRAKEAAGGASKASVSEDSEEDSEGADEQDAADAEFEDDLEDEGELDDEQGVEPEDSSIVLDLVDAGEAAGLSPEEDELAYLREVPDGVPIAQLSGITHGDCERFSRDFGTALDVEDLVPGAEYLLEASSPGLDRKLTKPEEFARFTGVLCKVQTFTPIAGNRHWQGHLGPADSEKLTLIPVAAKTARKKKKAAEPETGKSVEIAFSNIEKAQLVPEF